MVEKTLERAKLWEVQTPQVVRPDLLKRGYALVAEKGLEVCMLARLGVHKLAHVVSARFAPTYILDARDLTHAHLRPLIRPRTPPRRSPMMCRSLRQSASR